MKRSLTYRTGWLLAGITTALLAGGTVATAGTAFAAEDPGASPQSSAAGSSKVDLNAAVDAAMQSKSDCEAVGAMLDDTDDADAPVWGVLLECEGGELRYVEVDAHDGKVQGGTGAGQGDTADQGGTTKPGGSSSSDKGSDGKKSDSKKSDGKKKTTSDGSGSKSDNKQSSKQKNKSDKQSGKRGSNKDSDTGKRDTRDNDSRDNSTVDDPNDARGTGANSTYDSDAGTYGSSHDGSAAQNNR